MTVARLVYFSLLDQRVCRIKAAWLTKTFVWIDVLCFLTQATGGGMMSVTDLADDNPIISIGKRLYMGGCGAQLGFVILFCVIIVRLHIKAKRELRGDMNMRRPIVLAWVMFAVLMMIIVSHQHGCIRFDVSLLTNLTILADSSHLSSRRV